MRVTIVPEDNYMKVDGVEMNFAFAADANVHAIQWYGDHGTIEYKQGGAVAAIIEDVAPFVAMFNDEGLKRESAKKAASL